MPMSPHKGESQSDFMARCVPEMIGTGDDKRPQDQAVAICMDIWRNKDKVYADPGYQSDRVNRFAIDSEDEIRLAWVNINKKKNQQPYTEAQVKRIKSRISDAWKEKFNGEAPPEDEKGILRLRKMIVLSKQAEAPEPDDDESYDDFMGRCVSELTDDPGNMDEDEAEEACSLQWDESGRSAGPVMHKQRSSLSSGMTFILSDATPDRFGDIVEPKGWVTDHFSRNPIALFNHDKGFVIGKWTNLKMGDDLRADLELAPKGTSERIDEIRKLIEANILRAVSVGFRPLDDEPIDKKDPWGGTRYNKQELVECSVVAVPANPNALSVAKSLNISASTVRMVFGEHADKDIVQRNFGSSRGEHASNRGTVMKTGEHAEINSGEARKPMLLSKRIEDAQKHVVALQDQMNTHLETIDDQNPTEEQMMVTEDLDAKIVAANRHLANLKSIESRNGNDAADTGDVAGRALALRNNTSLVKPPSGFTMPNKKLELIDIFFRAALTRVKSRADGIGIDDFRRKHYGDDDLQRAVFDYVLKAATMPAETTVTGWAAELVRQIYADFMQVLLPLSVFPNLAAKGLALTFGPNGRINIPTRNLTPSVAGSFVGEGLPIPVRQGQFATQAVTPKKLAVITTWTREMDEFSMPAIEGLLRQAVLEDTAISLDAVLLDNNPATAVRPPGLRSYQATQVASVAGGYAAFVADYEALYGALLTLTNGNVRRPTIILNPQQVLSLSMMQPPAAAAPLWPFNEMLNAGKVGKAELIESSNQPPGQVIMVDAADFTSAGVEGPRLEISDQATLHMEDTTPLDISAPGTPNVVAAPVKSMWQTDSLALRLIQRMNWIMRRPVVSWTTGVNWR